MCTERASPRCPTARAAPTAPGQGSVCGPRTRPAAARCLRRRRRTASSPRSRATLCPLPRICDGRIPTLAVRVGTAGLAHRSGGGRRAPSEGGQNMRREVLKGLLITTLGVLVVVCPLSRPAHADVASDLYADTKGIIE